MSVNKFICIGNVGKDPDIKNFDNGSQVASFSLGLSERGYTAQNGTVVPDRTEWVNIVCWRGLAKIVEQYVKKGSQVYIEGKLRTRSYDDANGVKRYVTEIYADSIELLGGKPKDQATPQTSQASPIEESDDLPF